MKDLSDKALSYKLGVSRKIAIEIKKIIYQIENKIKSLTNNINNLN